MTDDQEKNVTLNTVHEDLQAGFADLKGEIRTGFTDLKATLVSGFRNMPSRETGEEMVRLLREGNRLQEGRFAHLDASIREQHLEVQQALRVMAEGIGNLTREVRILAGEFRTISTDIKALIARIDALIRGREDGSPNS